MQQLWLILVLVLGGFAVGIITRLILLKTKPRWLPGGSLILGYLTAKGFNQPDLGIYLLCIIIALVSDYLGYRVAKKLLNQ